MSESPDERLHTSRNIPLPLATPEPGAEKVIDAPGDWIADEIRERGVPPGLQRVYRQALGGNSLRAAHNAMCLECQGWEDRVQQAVAECGDRGCPLWAMRPYQKRG